MRFTFRLETLWKLRTAERDECRRRLAEARSADEIVAQMQADVERESAGTAEACRRASQPGTIDVDQILITQRYQLVLAARQAALRTQRVQLAAEIERRRLAVVEADRQVKALCNLHDKQYSEHAAREARQEAKRLDEIAQTRPPEEQIV